MVKIAIDSKESSLSLLLTEVVKEFFDIEKTAYQIEQLKEDIQCYEVCNKYDIFFVQEGMSTASFILNKNSCDNWKNKAQIIILTDADKYEKVKGFNSVYYVGKSHCELKIYDILKESNWNNKSCSLLTETGVLNIPPKDIYYFEYYDRKLKIVTTSGTYYSKKYTLKYIMDRFEKYNFYLIHKSFVANMQYVKLIKGTKVYLYLPEKCVLPLAQKRVTEFKRVFNEYRELMYDII